MEQKRMPIFAERFAQLREEKTQGEFAEFLGISRPTVGFYENGTRIPDALVLRQIAEKCDVSVDWLLGLTEYPCKEQQKYNLEDMGFSAEVAEKLHTMSSAVPLAMRGDKSEAVVGLSNEFTLFLAMLEDSKFNTLILS